MGLWRPSPRNIFEILCKCKFRYILCLCECLKFKVRNTIQYVLVLRIKIFILQNALKLTCYLTEQTRHPFSAVQELRVFLRRSRDTIIRLSQKCVYVTANILEKSLHPYENKTNRRVTSYSSVIVVCVMYSIFSETLDNGKFFTS